jgi:enamine deaminase RidA (YjgF/YER057c/UK114 family)
MNPAAIPERVMSPDAPDPLGRYTHAVRAAGLLFCSGQGARDPKTGREAGITLSADGVVEAYDIRVQTDVALSNVRNVLRAAGVAWGAACRIDHLSEGHGRLHCDERGLRSALPQRWACPYDRGCQ